MKLITETITLPVDYTVPESSVEARDAIVASGQCIQTVCSNESNESAGVVVRNIRRHMKDVESVRKELTQPLLDAQRRIKQLADEHISPISHELQRLEGLATAFLASERRRIEAEEKIRQEAFLKAQAEQFEAQDRAAKLAASIKTEGGLNQAIKAEEKAIEAREQVQEIISKPEQFLQKSKGQSLRRVLCYEVTDIRAVYASRPELCKLEISPAAVKATCNPDFPVAGLKLWWEDKSTFSSR